MLVQTAHIDGTTRDEYDALLASGWFRGTGILYKSEIVCITEQIYSVQHIRHVLFGAYPAKKNRKILRKNDTQFRVTFGIPSSTDRKEELYQSQINRFKAFVHLSLGEIIQGGWHDGEFETKELCVYDGDKLIAVSYFDVGKKALASLMCLYDPAYKKYSLGIYTMLKEMEYGRKRGMYYYYPGYILDLPSAFDYKLSIGECEWMGPDRTWYHHSALPEFLSKGELIRSKMMELQDTLLTSGYVSQLRIYPYFTVGQVMREHKSLLRLPCYLEFTLDGKTLAASYDSEEDAHYVFHLVEATELEFTQQLDLSDDYRNSAMYDLRVLKTTFRMPLTRWLHNQVERAKKAALHESL